MLKSIDFGRSMNPAFLIETPSISPKIRAIIQKCLPGLNAFNPTRAFLSYALLAIHIKDLGQELIDLAYTGKDSDEVMPQMKKTGAAVCHLAISLWCPYLYIIGTESYELISRLRQIDPSKGAAPSIQSTANFLLQSLYLVSILGKSPTWQNLLDQIPLGAGKTHFIVESIKTDKKALTLPPEAAPFLLSAQHTLELIGIIPLFFRNFQETIKEGHAWAFLGRFVQACYLLEKTQYDNFKNLDFELLLYFATIDLLNELVNLMSTLPHLLSVASLLNALFDVAIRYESWTKSNFHVGATGDPVKMDDLVGCDQAKNSILEALDHIKDRSKYEKLGPSNTTKGILFYGPPGTGKSMLAKAFATAADNAQFLEQPGSSFVAIYVGQGANNVRKLFSKASRLAQEDPNRLVVVFIDEINAIGGIRNVSLMGGDKEISNTTEAFLVEMDKTPKNVIVIGATNTNPQELDKAFTRSGRFDEHIEFKLPTEKERVAILSKLGSAYTVDPKINGSLWNEFAQQTEKWCFADFTNLFTQASRQAGYKGHSQISKEIFEETLDKLKKQKDQSGSSGHLPMYV